MNVKAIHANMNGNHVRELLEYQIDVTGSADLLWAITEIMRDKAAHVRDTYQDEITAKAWEGTADAVYEAGLTANRMHV